MLPTDFEGSNSTLEPPPILAAAIFPPIRAYTGQDDQGLDITHTVWQPSHEDKAAINEGRGIIVRHYFTEEPPPFVLFTLNEKGDPNL